MVPVKFNDYYTINGTGPTFNIKMKPCTRVPKTFHDELLWNAEYIYNHKDGDIYLFYSGGIDSEYVLEIFLSLGMKIIPVIVRYENDVNLHDIKYAYEYCESRKLKPIIVDINFEQLVKSGRYLELAESVNCVAWQFPSLMEATLKFDGTILLGSEEPHFSKNKQTQLWYFNEMERITGLWHRWFKKHNISGTPCMLSYTPETIFGFMNDPLVIDLVNNAILGKEGTNSSKNKIYNRVFNSIMPRIKYTGFEQIKELPIFHHPDVQKVISDPYDSTLIGNGLYQAEYYKLRDMLTV